MEAPYARWTSSVWGDTSAGDRDLNEVVSPGGYPDPEVAAAVDAAAVPLALRLASERYPMFRVVSQNHSNPGFDLAVLEGNLLVRYIELKSTTKEDGGFYMSDYQLQFSRVNAERYSLLILAGLDPSTGTCTPYWFDGDVGEHFAMRAIQWRGVLSS